MKLGCHLHAIVVVNGDFGDAMVFRIAASRLQINNCIHGTKLEFDFLT